MIDLASRYEVLCSDNIEAMTKLLPNTFSSCITDPPYGMEMADWDKNVPPVETWKAVHTVLKPGGFVLSFCAPEYYHKMATKIEDAGFRCLGVVSWLVTTKMVKQNRLKPAQELIFVGQKELEGSVESNWEKWGCGKINIEHARIPWDKPPPTGWRKNGHTRRAFGGDVEKAVDQKVETVDANPAGRYPSDVIGWFDDPEIQKFFYAPRATRRERGEYNDHPTPKPISLMCYLCRVYGGNHDEKIIDPFVGSGSTGIAALQEGFRFYGIDLSQHYVDIAKQRIEEHCKDETPELLVPALESEDILFSF